MIRMNGQSKDVGLNYRKVSYDEKEENWITALSSACAGGNVDMPDRTTRARGKSTINLLQQMSGQILSMRWLNNSLLSDL